MARWELCSTPDCSELHQGSGKCPDCRHEASKERGHDNQRKTTAEPNTPR